MHPKMIRPGTGAVSTRPLLSARLGAWLDTYWKVAAEIEKTATVKGESPLTPGGRLDIATTAATVAASLVAGAELD